MATALDGLNDAGLRVTEVETPEQRVFEDGAFVASVSVALEAFDPETLGGPIRITGADGARVDGDTVRFDLTLTADLADGSATVAREDPLPAEDRPVPASDETADALNADGGRDRAAVAAADAEEDLIPSGGRSTTKSDAKREPDEESASDGDADAETPRESGDETDSGGGVDSDDGADSDAEVDSDDETDSGDGVESDGGVDDRADSEGSSGADLPPHRDPEQLREVYEAHDTFADMTEALGVDVTSQTVRHHMIKHGIHEPRTNRSTDVSAASRDLLGAANSASRSDRSERSADDESGGESAPAGGESEGLRPDESDSDGVGGRRSSDGADDAETKPSAFDAEDEPIDAPERADEPVIGEIDPSEVDLPPDLTLEQIREAVYDSDTLYQAQRTLGVDNETATRLLRELRLLDFVTGRAATKPDREVSIDEIDRRIRAAATTAGASGQRESGDA